MRAAGRRGGGTLARHVRALLLAASALALLLAACGEGTSLLDASDPTPPPGWSRPSITSADGTELYAYLWRRDPERIAIYLHEYLADQGVWWPSLGMGAAQEASVLTFDLRGHGETEGEFDDLGGMLEDTRAAVAFARAHGYTDVALVGSGMGAALAMVVAADDPDVFVIGLSAPIEFAGLNAGAAAPALSDRLALLATEGDLSAAHSLERFVALAQLPEDRWLLDEGRTHGVDMLHPESRGQGRAYFAEMLRMAWNR